MAIKKSNIYLTDTQNSVQSSIPLVIIYKGIRPEDVDEIDTLPDSEKIFLSTNNIYFDGNYYEPLLTKIPSIKQTVDFENKNFRIQTNNIEVNNTEFHGRMFTDDLQLVSNCAIRIYFKSQSCKTLEDCILVSQSTTVRFTQKNKLINIISEDSTQALLSKTIPELASGASIAQKDQNKVIPIVYGHVNKSPVIKQIDPLTADLEGHSALTSLIVDNKPITRIFSDLDYTQYPSPVTQYMQSLSPIYIYDQDYLNILNYTPLDRKTQLEFQSGVELDIDNPFFEIDDNRIIVTDELKKFQTALSNSFFYRNYNLKDAMMSRILRKFTGIDGEKKSIREWVESSIFNFGGRLFATTDWTNDNPWIGSGTTYPRDWSRNMFQEENYYTQTEACFPFAHDNYESWDPTNGNLDTAEGCPNIGDEAQSNLLANWNVPNPDGTPSIFDLKPINYLNYIKEEDDKALCWYGEGHSNLQDNGSFVNWKFILDDTGLNNQCMTFCLIKLYHWKNPNVEYGTSGTHEYISGSVLWSDTVETPIYNRIPAYYVPVEFDELNVPYAEWGPWYSHPPSGPLLSGYDNIIPSEENYDGEFLAQAYDWKSISQIQAVNVGQPMFYHATSHTESIQYTTGALQYLHFIQDAFIEYADSKDWYVNVLGRKTNDITWSPFNSWTIQTLPFNVDNLDYSDEEVLDYIQSIGYSENFGSEEDTSGGELGWIVNTGTEFSLQGKLSQFDIMPKRMWYIDSRGNGSVFEDGNWSVNRVVNLFKKFIIFSTSPVIVKPFINYDFPSHFIRMHHIVGTENDWEEGFTPLEAIEQIYINYEGNGWKNYLYSPEINVGGAVETPHGVIQNLITSETTYSASNFNDLDIYKAFCTHQGWRMAFTINEQKELKEIVQELSTNTKLLPRFKADGTFDFTTLKPYYNISDVNFHIQKHDVIDWSFELTKIENVYNQHKIHYEYDYAKEEYNKISSDFIYTRSEKIFDDYGAITKFLYEDMPNLPDNIIYDIKEIYNKEPIESIKEFEAKYIRHRYTAEQLKKHLLMDHINEHLIINLTLNNKYTHIEIGDVLYIDKLSNELGLGYQYWSYEIKGGQLLYPFYFVTEVSKSNNVVNLKLKRLHRLQYGLPFWLLEQLILDSNYVLPNNYVDIGKVEDLGGIWKHTMHNFEEDFDTAFMDYPQDINNEFQISWFPDVYSNALYEQDSVIRLDVVQNSYYNQDTQNWNVQLQEEGVWYDVGVDTNSFELTSYANPDNNYNGYVIIKAKNDNNTDDLIQGRVRIIDNLNRHYEESFYQDVSIEVPDGEGSGDVNGDGVINVLDAVTMIQYIFGNIEFTEEQILAGDMNEDGGVNIQDIVLLIAFILEN